MGTLWGKTATTTQHAATIHAEILLAPGGTLPIDGAAQGGADERAVMLVGGEAFASPRHAWWNFVSSSCERIEQARTDWREGRFPKVPGDEREFIPIPESPLTRSA